MSVTHRGHTFDYVPREDERSKKFGIMEATEDVREHSREWRVSPSLNQGRQGACVGHGWVHEMLATPVRVDLSRMKQSPMPTAQQLAFWVYYEAQKIDYWAGEDYEGTSVLAGAKIMQRLGVLREYRWGQGAAGIRRGLLTTGPVVLGVPWLEGMFDAPDGVLNVEGDEIGGHCVLAHAYAEKGDKFDDEPGFRILNSWGPRWGEDGGAWVRMSGIEKLMGNYGEACVPFRRSYGR